MMDSGRADTGKDISEAVYLRLCMDVSGASNHFLKELLVNKIATQLTQQLEAATVITAAFKDAVLRSPAFYGVTSGYALSEYIKNTADAGGARLYVMVCADSQGVTCMVVDDGSGFPLSFLGNQTSKLVDYNTKIAGGSKGRIVSQKREDKFSLGGEGLGIATLARILNIAAGKFEIGNIESVPHELQQKLKVNFDMGDKGAVLVMTSPLYSAGLLALFKKNAYSRYMDQDNSVRYTNYLQQIDMDLERQQEVLRSRSEVDPSYADVVIETEQRSILYADDESIVILPKKLKLDVGSEIAFGGAESEISVEPPNSSASIGVSLNEIEVASPTRSPVHSGDDSESDDLSSRSSSSLSSTPTKVLMESFVESGDEGALDELSLESTTPRSSNAAQHFSLFNASGKREVESVELAARIKYTHKRKQNSR